MTRIATPPDDNPTTERFARTMGDGRLCDAESAQAIFKELDALDYGLAWWVCIVILATLSFIVMVVTA
jgi:hypothetical protein